MNKVEEVGSETSTSSEKPQESKPEKTKRVREDKIRKKDEKSIEHMLKTLSNYSTPEEKLTVMYQKYADIFNEHRALQGTVKLMEKKATSLHREKEQLQAEHNKAILTKSRLENLCRELQRQNKAIKDESITAMREEEEKKREVAAMFHSTLTELGNLVSKNNDKNNKLRDDNLDMSTKLKSVCEQYEKKEQHVDKLAKQLELEMQLTEAKLAKAKMEMTIEKDTLNREKQQLLLEVAQYKAAVEEQRGTETGLRNQIQMYNDKYDEFHKALLQSNEAIGGFKQEMEKMSKQITRLEKETMTWRTKYEATHKALLKMTDEKLTSDKNTCGTLRKLAALQGLCRSLQGECASLRDELKKKGVNGEDKIELDRTDKDTISNVVSKLEEEMQGLITNDKCPMRERDVDSIVTEIVEVDGEIQEEKTNPEETTPPKSPLKEQIENTQNKVEEEKSKEETQEKAKTDLPPNNTDEDKKDTQQKKKKKKGKK